MADPEEEMLDQQTEDDAVVDVSVTMVETTEVIETQTEQLNGSTEQNGNGANHPNSSNDANRELEVVELDRPSEAAATPRTTYLQ